jgi:hypothetical protein
MAVAGVVLLSFTQYHKRFEATRYEYGSLSSCSSVYYEEWFQYACTLLTSSGFTYMHDTSLKNGTIGHAQSNCSLCYFQLVTLRTKTLKSTLSVWPLTLEFGTLGQQVILLPELVKRCPSLLGKVVAEGKLGT